jgi:hypothetical protein
MFRASHRPMLLAVLALLAAAPSAAADTVSLGLDTTGIGASVQLDPTGTLTRCAGQRCFYDFPRGTAVTVTATPNAQGSRFARWLGACGDASRTCVVTLDQSKTLVARFSPVALYVDRQSGRGSVSVAADALLHRGRRLPARPDPRRPAADRGERVLRR